MKNTFGSSVCLTIFGESHGPAIGAVLDGPCLRVDTTDFEKVDREDVLQSVKALMAEQKMQ